MNAQLKTILLTVLTLSCFVIALVELSGVSQTALFNKYGIGHNAGGSTLPKEVTDSRDAQVAAMPKTSFEFAETKHDFGTITDGAVVKHAYHFKNTGNQPLLISRVDVSCGCTVPSFPQEPIPPGGEGDIVLEFNSHNRVGHQQKNAMVHSNGQLEAYSIGFTVDVNEK